MKLFIDSATYYLYLAIIGDDKEECFIRFGKNDHSETLVDNIAHFLSSNNVEVEKITEIIIGRGPGSYTGIRITGTVGKVFAFTTKVPFKSFSSLDLLLASKLDTDGKYMARIIAKKDHSYIKVIEVKNGQINTILDDKFVNDEELKEYQDAEEIMISEELLNNINLAKNILKFDLLKDEDVYTYVPNYLRSSLQ